MGIGLILLFTFGIGLVVALFVHWIWMLVDCAQAPHDRMRPNQQILWLLVMIFTGWIGSILYHLVVRRRRNHRLRAPDFPPTGFRG
ncbi:MAG: hypothetical protein EAZ36_05535 [Verrucomicrobia bacterium]|nr:MAG: hypothetical protein EAZ36_05535 [Verrucomicrobiota bacterium]